MTADSGDALRIWTVQELWEALQRAHIPQSVRFVEYSEARESRPAPPLDSKVNDLLAYGRMQAHGFLVKQDREQYQFWQGWNAALERLAPLPSPPAALPAKET